MAWNCPQERRLTSSQVVYHVMLMDLKQEVKAGATVPVTLVVEGKDGKKETIEVSAPVKALGAPMTQEMSKHKH